MQLGFINVYRKYLENEESLNTFTLFNARALSVVSLENFIILKSTKLSESDFYVELRTYRSYVQEAQLSGFTMIVHVYNALSN